MMNSALKGIFVFCVGNVDFELWNDPIRMEEFCVGSKEVPG